MSARIEQTAPGTGAARTSEAAEGSIRLRRTAAGLTIVASGVIIFAGYLATPYGRSSAEIAQLRTVAAHPMQTQVAAVLLHFGYLLLVPTAFALVHLARRGARRLSYTGLVLSVLGAGLSGLLVTDFFSLALAQQLPLATAARVSEAAKQYGLGVLIAKPSALAAVLGLVLLAAAAWRARWVSWWPAAVLFVGWVVAISGDTLVRAGVGSGLVLVGLAALGVRVLRMSDGEWEEGRPA
jgi:hypothetical protein